MTRKKKRIKIITPFDYKPSDGKVCDEVSITVQGEAQTIAEIVARYSQGIPLPTRVVEYVNGENFEVSQVDNPEADLSEKFQEAMETLENLKRAGQAKRASETKSERSEAKASDQESENAEPGQAQKGSEKEPVKANNE